MSKKVLFALTSHDELGSTGRRTGFYVPEVAHPAAVFREAGYKIAYVSVRGGAAPQDGVRDDDAVVTEFLADPATAKTPAATPAPGEVKAEEYDAIYFAGGHGTMWDFPESEELAALAAAIYEQGTRISPCSTATC